MISISIGIEYFHSWKSKYCKKSCITSTAAYSKVAPHTGLSIFCLQDCSSRSQWGPKIYTSAADSWEEAQGEAICVWPHPKRVSAVWDHVKCGQPREYWPGLRDARDHVLRDVWPANRHVQQPFNDVSVTKTPSQYDMRCSPMALLALISTSPSFRRYSRERSLSDVGSEGPCWKSSRSLSRILVGWESASTASPKEITLYVKPVRLHRPTRWKQCLW